LAQVAAAGLVKLEPHLWQIITDAAAQKTQTRNWLPVHQGIFKTQQQEASAETHQRGSYRAALSSQHSSTSRRKQDFFHVKAATIHRRNPVSP